MDNLLLTPIGEIRTCFKTKNGTPRQGMVSSNSRGIMTIHKKIFTNPEHSLDGLKHYSYAWILFAFHLNANKGVKAKVKPPRLDGAKLGIFATRSPHRPNPIGLTLAKLECVDGASVTFSGLDIVDGTPILDIKPYISMYDTPKQDDDEKSAHCDKTDGTCPVNEVVDGGAVGSTLWSKPLLPELKVAFTRRAENDIERLEDAERLIADRQSLRDAIAEVLGADPRSTYRRKKCSDRLYYFVLDDCHVTAWFDYSCKPALAEVLRIKPLHTMEDLLSKS